MTVSAADITNIVNRGTKGWTKQRKAEERFSRSRSHRGDIFESSRLTFTDVAHAILPAGYREGSEDGAYPLSKRQFFYVVRDQFRAKTGRELAFEYFAGTLLVKYMNQHPETESWRITADARGTLTIPNCGYDVRIPVSTLEIDSYLHEHKTGVEALEIDARVPSEWPGHLADHRYQALLYIEKEGFDPLLEEAQIAERFDIAIVSNKGQSVVATRRLVDTLCSVDGGVPLFVVHDFDKAGFEISQRLTQVSEWAEANDRVTYRFQNKINVTDLGLRLTDVTKYGLKGEPCEFKGRFASDSICTAEEKKYLRSDRRVELNELPPRLFLEWLEGKLVEHVPRRRLVPDDGIIENAYRRARAVAEINQAVAEVSEKAIASAKLASPPTDLRQQIQEMVERDDIPWDAVLYQLAYSEMK